MGLSAIREQREIIISTIKSITRGEWKVLVIDEASKKIIDNAVKEDDILNENIANIERIEEKRDMNPDMDAIYLLSPKPHIVDCLMADFERRRYRKCFLVWTALLDPQLRHRFDKSRQAQEQIANFQTLPVDYFPRESHLITFRDPWSFPMLYHPACSQLVLPHMKELAQKIVGVCVSLGEYPQVRWYKPRNDPPNPKHEASVLCEYLANEVQSELDSFANLNRDYPPPTNRPPGILMITDRSLDLMAPLIHEFTYQAMAHDLLPIKVGDKVLYKTVVNEGGADQQEKEMEIGEKDKIWVENRHRHMKDTIEKLMGDFQRFIDENPHFTNTEGDATSLNAIKDMLAGLPQFQELKEAYSLHLSMAQECMNIFQHHRLPDLAAVEQTLATGFDEDLRKPKNVSDQVVRLLDDDAIGPSDRLRLIMMYCLYREGMIIDDVQRMLIHAKLPSEVDDTKVISNLDLLGGRTLRADVRDKKPTVTPIFPVKTQPAAIDEEYALSRFEPNLKIMLEEMVSGRGLDTAVFPYTRQPMDNNAELAMQSQASLRSAKPTWARNRMSAVENRQRVIVFMAGGATYSESRACYEVSNTRGKDVFLVSSHMLTPPLFIRQLRELDASRRRLDLPIDRPQPKAPDHLFMRNDPPPPRPPPQNLVPGGGLPTRGHQLQSNGSANYDRPPPQPPTAGLAAMSMNSASGRQPIPLNGVSSSDSKKLEKKSKVEGEEKKKKRGFFHKKDKS
ncbi:Sec1 family protein [Amylocarpus encephaloides]|uniref:Sec1 family protein n=1 Tax=Amylocarpus encephaloides TaxID=45428 RepID=A0A9P7YRT9_9HELO|nr:Sec1 family protein [Amylocarpus encephaloides]